MASSIQQQLTADSFLCIHQQHITADSFLYIRPSIPAGQQELSPTVPSYNPLPSARSLRDHRATLPTVSMPRPRIAKAARRAHAPQTRTPAQRAARQRSFHQRLAAVNGITSPSKVPRGQHPWAPPPPKKKKNQIYPCARCGYRCSYRENLRSHFPNCVKRNGNPDGLRWSDAVNGVVEAPIGDFELERHEDDEYYRMEDKWQEEEELRDVLEGLDGHDDDDNDDYEDHRQEDELQEEEGPRDVLQEMFPTDELANKDAIPIDPRLEDYKMAMGGELTVQDVLDQAFADIGNSKLPALRLEDLKPEDFELEWPKWQV